MKRLIFLLLLIAAGQGQAQTLRLPWRINSSGSQPPVVATGLSITGPDSVAEGSSGSFRVLSTVEGTTTDITESVTFTASRGAVSGLTVSAGNPVMLYNAANTIRGDHRYTRLTATYQGQTVTRDIILADATSPTSTATASPRFVSIADIAKWPMMKTGDYIIEGATSASSTVYNINATIPQLAPEASVWLKGGSYLSVGLVMNQTRIAEGLPPVTIRNYDGQFRCRNSFQFQGAKGVRVTGEYVPGVGGDPDYPCHEGGYAFSHDRYGITLDNEWTNSSTPGLMAYNGSDRLEFDHIRITGGYFSGIQINTDNYDMSLPGSTVHVPFTVTVHDMLIDCTDSEGMYIGNTGEPDQKAFVYGRYYNNRLLFTGSENQWGQTKDVEVSNNVTLASTLWRDQFQPSQDNNIQLHVRYPKALIANNLTMSSGDKFINGQSQADSLGDYSNVSADTVVLRNNAHLFNRGPVFGYFNTRTIYRTKKNPIVGMNLKFERNLYGFDRFAYNEVYGAKTQQPFILQLAVISAKVFILNNVYDGSSAVRTSWFTNSESGTTTVTQTGNTLNGSVPLPEFENFTGGIDLAKMARTELWAASSANNYGSDPSLGLIKAPITYAMGEIIIHKGYLGRTYFYECKATGNAGIEPGYSANWKTYWNALYWDRKTGLVVRNPTDLSGLSHMPPMDVRIKPGTFYRLRNIGLLD